MRTKSVVPWWQDRLSRFVTRRKGLFKFLAQVEGWAEAPDLDDVPIEKPIYVCGLARAGSTLLLECLASHPQMVSHRYRDFPLLYTPLWWNRFLDRAAGSLPEPSERFHRDRMLVTPDSPEAMEEVFWMGFFPDSHAPKMNNVLDETVQNPHFERFYQQHIRKILLLRGGTRYVCKGNYHVARMQYLQKIFPDARFIIPVRQPAAHVASLMKQHRLFCELERDDKRVLNYMRRSGHFEFGLDLRFINFGDAEPIRGIEQLWEAGEAARGWARYWAVIHRFLAQLLERDESLRCATRVVSHEELCRSPEAVLHGMFDHCDLPIDPRHLAHLAERIQLPDYYTPDFSDEVLDAIEAETAESFERILRFQSPPP